MEEWAKRCAINNRHCHLAHGSRRWQIIAMHNDMPIKVRVRRGVVKFEQTRPRVEIVRLAKMLLANDDDGTREGQAMAAGKRIASGSRDVAELMTIAAWKSPRRRALMSDNPPDLVAEALDIACSARSERIAVAAMAALSGVGLPMASAIMTCVDPERFTVIDIRALDALGERGRGITASVYEAYLAFCRIEAARLKVPLRTLDRALWQGGVP